MTGLEGIRGNCLIYTGYKYFLVTTGEKRRVHTWPAMQQDEWNSIWLLREQAYEMDFVFFLL
jgi:hypothetical protein